MSHLSQTLVVRLCIKDERISVKCCRFSSIICHPWEIYCHVCVQFLALIDQLVTWICRTRASQWTIVDGLGFNPKEGGGVRRYINTVLILHIGDGSSALIAWRPANEVDHLQWHRLRRSTYRHTLNPFASQSRGMTLSNTDKDKCCLIFSVLLGTELTDWSNQGLLH